MTNVKLYKNYRKGRKRISDHGGRIAITRELTRILTYLQETKKYAIRTDFVKEGIVKSNHAADALNWLVANGLVKKEHMRHPVRRKSDSFSNATLVTYSLTDKGRK